MVDKHMDIAEFRNLGLLQEVNRRFFHPIGLALAVNAAKDGEEPIVESLSYIFDCRDDPEGFCYAKLNADVATKRSEYYEDEVFKHLHPRMKLFGTPLGATLPGGWQPLSTFNMELP
jgi:hypothetical protein